MDLFYSDRKLFDKVVWRRYTLKDEVYVVIYNLNHHRIAILDDVSALIFASLADDEQDGLRRLMIENDLSEQDIAEFIKDLIDNAILNDSASEGMPHIGGDKSHEDEDRSVLEDLHKKLYSNSYLYSVHIDVTNQCNMRCIHCYHPFDEYDKSNVLRFDDIKKIIDEAFSLGVFRVTISGGEPFLRCDIFDILEYISRKGMIIDVFTNATLLNNDVVVNKLMDYNINEVGISVYSTRKDIHELITQAPSYENTFAAIAKLRACGILCKLKCILMKYNIDCYDELVRYSIEQDCTLVFDTGITPKLNGDIAPTELMLEWDDILALSMDSSTKFYPIPLDSLDPEHSPCNAGKYGLYVDSMGNVYPCVSLQMYLGNIHEDSLINIWHHNVALKRWQKMKNKDFIGFNEHSYCRYCMEICAGIAQLETGQYDRCPKSACYQARAREEAHKRILMKTVSQQRGHGEGEGEDAQPLRRWHPR